MPLHTTPSKAIASISELMCVAAVDSEINIILMSHMVSIRMKTCEGREGEAENVR